MRPTDEDRIWDLVAVWEEKFQQGDDLPVIEVCRDDLELLNLVEERIDALKRVAWLNRPSEAQKQTQEIATGSTAISMEIIDPPQEEDEIGRLGAYRILDILGQGGIGVVFLAEDTQLNRRVAIKTLNPSTATNEIAKRRFIREAQAAASIHHENVVTIHNVAERSGIPFLVMELLEGESLEDRLQREGKLPLPETIRIGKEIAQGLAAAHAAGLIHRDIKPANIWLDSRNQRTKILDFGLARAVEKGREITQIGFIVGTPAYLSPEQARGEKLDPKSDLFSFGCVLYRMVTGRLPFDGNDTLATLLALAKDTPTDPRKLDSPIPIWLSDLIMQMLAKKSKHRPKNAQAVRLALAEKGKNRSNGIWASWRSLIVPILSLLILIGGILALARFLGLYGKEADFVPAKVSRANAQKRQQANLQPDYSKDSDLKNAIIGHFKIHETEVTAKGEENHGIYDWQFRKDHTANAFNKALATWKVEGRNIIVTYKRKFLGRAVIRQKDADTFVGTYTRQNGQSFKWLVRRTISSK